MEFSDKHDQAKEEISKRRIYDLLIAFVVFFSALLALYWPVFFEGKVLFPSTDLYQDGYFGDYKEDSLEEILPWRSMVADRLREGDLPLWNPLVACGMPLLANNQSAVFSPGSLLYFIFESPERAISFNTILHLLLGAFAIWGLLRLMNAGRVAPILSGLLFLHAGSWTTIQIGHDATPTLAWVIVLWFFMVLAIKRRNLNYGVAGSLAFGVATVSGNLMVAYLGFWLIALYMAVVLSGFLYRKDKSAALFITKLGFSVLGIGILIGCMQILPTYDLLGLVTRDYDVSFILRTTMLPESVFRIIMIEFGPAGIALILIGGFQRRSLHIFCFILSIVSILITVGIGYDLLQKVGPFFGNFSIASYYYNSIFLPTTVILAGAGIHRVISSATFRSRPILWGVILAISVFAFGPSYSELPNISDPELLTPPAKRIEPILATEDGSRIARYYSEDFPPNIGMRYGLRDIHVYDSFVLENISSLMEFIEPGIFQNQPVSTRLFPIKKINTLENPTLDLLSVGWVLSDRPMTASGYELNSSDPSAKVFSKWPGWWLYRNTEVLPRATVVAGIKRFESNVEILDAVANKDFNPGGCAFVRGDLVKALDPGNCDSDIPGSVAITKDGNDSVELQATMNRNGFLRLADTYAPGWEAEVDGKLVPIIPSETVFRLIPLEKGSHKIVFRYRPLAVRVGMALSGIGIVFWLAWLIIAFRARSPKSQVSPPNA